MTTGKRFHIDNKIRLKIPHKWEYNLPHNLQNLKSIGQLQSPLAHFLEVEHMEVRVLGLPGEVGHDGINGVMVHLDQL